MDHEDFQTLQMLKDTFEANETRLYDHLTATFRWLMATLFAANGGALIALSNSDAKFNAPYFAMQCFAVGLVLSLLMGVASGFASYKATAKFAEIRFKIHQSMISSRLEPTLQDDLASLKITWKTWIPSYVGLLSLIVFTVGICVTYPSKSPPTHVPPPAAPTTQHTGRS